jgi:hypothetical protein
VKLLLRARYILFALLIVVMAGAIVVGQPRGLLTDSRPPAHQIDVLVIGGSPAGVAAALAAARQGKIVLLADPRPYLGTVWTGAMMNMLDLSRNPSNGEPMIRGIFHEVYREINNVVFDPRHMREILAAIVANEPGIRLELDADFLRPLIEGGRVVGAEIRQSDGTKVAVKAWVTIDATDDGDVAAAAGVRFTYGREASGLDRRAMPATLMYRLRGVDWDQLSEFALAHRKSRQPSGVHQGYAWGFREPMRGYESATPGLSAHDLNVGRLADGTVLVNSLQIHDLDGTSPKSRADGYERALRELPHLVTYLRAHVPGFADVALVEAAPELYIRETRHLAGLYTLTARDIAAQTRFWDRIGAASYPVDLHQYVKGERYPYRPVRSPYTLPLRALVTAKVDGLFIASRALSATYQAAGSARVIPTTMAMGEGVGVAAAVAVERSMTPHQLSQSADAVSEVQRRLVNAGALIDF